MASLMQWLSEEYPGSLPFDHGWRPRGVPERPTKLQVIAALSRMSGGGGYGVMDNSGIYGRTGLEQNEAFLWWELRAFTNGWLQGQDEAEAGAFFLALKAEWARVEALVASEQHPPETPPP